MDITKIGVSAGEPIKFKDIVHPSVTKEVDRYIERSMGPEYVFRYTKPTSAIDALDEAFKPLEAYKDYIGIVIDGSTTRGFAEPSQAALYAQHLKIKGAVCFDVSEACNGWARGAETAYMLFNTRKNLQDKYILVINNEYPPSTRGLVPKSNKDYKAVASYYVGLSFSYVCTCTLFEKSENYSWKFDHFTDTKYASYICVPLPQQSQLFLPHCDDYQVKLNEKYGQFILPKFHQVQEKMKFCRDQVDKSEKRKLWYQEAHVICHTFSTKIYLEMWKNHKFKNLSICYPQFGNLGSCSFPYIIHKSYNGQIPKDQSFSFIGNAAGGSNVVVAFTHQGQTELKRQMPLL